MSDQTHTSFPISSMAKAAIFTLTASAAFVIGVTLAVQHWFRLGIPVVG